MVIIYGVEALISYPDGHHFETKISYWSKKSDAQTIANHVQKLFNDSVVQGISVIIVDLIVKESKEGARRIFMKEDPFTKETSPREIHQKVEQADYAQASENVQAFLAKIASWQLVTTTTSAP